MDVRERRIPNKLTGLFFAAGLLFQVLVAVQAGTRSLVSPVLASITALVILGGIWMAGGVGAGDAKLIAGAGNVAGTAKHTVCDAGESGQVSGAAAGPLVAAEPDWPYRCTAGPRSNPRESQRHEGTQGPEAKTRDRVCGECLPVDLGLCGNSGRFAGTKIGT